MKRWLERLKNLLEKFGFAGDAKKNTRKITLHIRTKWTGYKKPMLYYKSRFFKRHEIAGLKEELVILLDRMRADCGFPFIINCGLRVGDKLSHGKGEAVDIKLLNYRSKSFQRQAIHQSALKVGITRIGLYDLHVHVDVSKELPQNVTWIGVSK